MRGSWQSVGIMSGAEGGWYHVVNTPPEAPFGTPDLSRCQAEIISSLALFPEARFYFHKENNMFHEKFKQSLVIFGCVAPNRSYERNNRDEAKGTLENLKLKTCEIKPVHI